MHIQTRGVEQHRHVSSAFLLWHFSKAPVLIIRQPYKSTGASKLLPPSPVSTWLMVVNRPQSVQREKNWRGIQSVSCYFLTNYFHLLMCPGRRGSRLSRVNQTFLSLDTSSSSSGRTPLVTDCPLCMSVYDMPACSAKNTISSQHV